jgi:hypothetical protein
MFFGSVVFELIGVSSKWLFLQIRNSFVQRKAPSFMEIWRGPRNADLQESVEHGWSNIFLGMGVMTASIFILKWITE